MREYPADRRLAIIGFGAMSRAVLSGLSNGTSPISIGALLVRSELTSPPPGVDVFQTVEQLVGWKPDLVAECAGHGAVSDTVPVLLSSGIDVIVASLGALTSPVLREKIEQASRAGGSKCHLVPGAIGGLDALGAAKIAGLSSVVYEGRKPPQAWRGTPAEVAHDLSSIAEPTVIFEGSADEACRLFPKNANVTAAVSLAGIGFADTVVRLIADPSIARNQHLLRAAGRFGEMDMRLTNEPLPENPKTSWLAALSIEQAIRRACEPAL